MNFSGWHPRTAHAPPPRRNSKPSQSARSSSATTHGRSRSRSTSNNHYPPPPKQTFEKPAFIQQPPPTMLNNDFSQQNPTSNHDYNNYDGNNYNQIHQSVNGQQGLNHQLQQNYHDNSVIKQQQQDHPKYNPEVIPSSIPGPSGNAATSLISSGNGQPHATSANSRQTMNTNSAVPITKLELSISAKNLKDRDVFSKSDPICVVFEAVHSPNQEGLTYQEVGRTEQINDCLNPEWIKKIIINYMFEERQRIKFEVYDIDSESAALSKHDFLGVSDT